MPILDGNHKKDAFLPTLLSFLTPEIKKDFLNPKVVKLMGENLKKELFGEEIQVIPQPDIKAKLSFLREVQKYYSEISASIERMRAIAMFVRQYPNYKSFKKYGITHTFYLRYHVENYFNEMYLFKERVNRFIAYLKSECNDHGLSLERKILDEIKKVFLSSIDGIIDTRRRHIHGVNRFTNKKFEQLESIEFFLQHMDDNKITNLLDILKKINYRPVRQEWFKIISNNNKSLDSFFDSILEKIKPIVFDKLLSKYKS